MTYLGSKSGAGVFQAIVSRMPPHRRYIEAFLGTGAVMRAKPPAEETIGIELDREVLSAFGGTDGVRLIEADAIDWISDADLRPDDLIYCDPPYLPETRTSKARYRHELTELDHRRLLDVLLTCPAQVMLSGYPSQLYDTVLHDWRAIEFQAMTRGGPRAERLWMNFPEERVAWHTFAGRDRTDRQRIKRKAERWARMYQDCTAGEQLAILAALLATHQVGRP